MGEPVGESLGESLPVSVCSILGNADGVWLALSDGSSEGARLADGATLTDGASDIEGLRLAEGTWLVDGCELGLDEGELLDGA